MEDRFVFRLSELFCGAGGIGLGASMVNINNVEIKHIWATDYEKDACDTYNKNIAPKAMICKDIREIDFNSLKKYGEIDCLTFGFPCNDFSSVGEQKGIDGVFGALYKYCVKALDTFRPSYFVAENVSGLKNANEGGAFQKIIEAFRGSGYNVYPNLYHFENYGIPQKRHRIIIVGIRNDINLTFKIPSYKPYKDIDNTVKTALGNIPENIFNSELTAQSPVVVERLKYIKEGENAFTADLPMHLKLNIKGAKISQIYKRLKANEPSYTITGSGGGGTHVYHYSENRALTNRERARLQTFPDSFEFLGAKESVRKQIGMAVPPAGIMIIFEALIKTILGIEYSCMEANIWV